MFESREMVIPGWLAAALMSIVGFVAIGSLAEVMGAGVEVSLIAGAVGGTLGFATQTTYFGRKEDIQDDG